MPIGLTLQDLSYLLADPSEPVLVKTGQITRVSSLPDGNVSYTGVGFKPDWLMLLSAVDGGTHYTKCLSICPGSIGYSGWVIQEYVDNNSGTAQISGYPINLNDGGGAAYTDTLSFTPDGFTVHWTKGSSPTSTFVTQYLALARRKNPIKAGAIYTSRVMTLDAGNVSYTGMGFKPSFCICLAAINGGYINSMGLMGGGVSDGWANANGVKYATGADIWCYDATGGYQYGIIGTYDSDGVTIGWSKGGSPTATITFAIMGLA